MTDDLHEKYCCAMRRHFLVGVVATREGEEIPTEAVDFALAFEPKLLIRIKFCPFCGEEIPQSNTMRTTG